MAETKTKTKYEMIMCIVNAGFSGVVMDAARSAGSRGGTVLHGHGTANREAEEFFNITIEPEKDVVLMVVPANLKDGVLKAVYDAAGMTTPGKGIAFSLPVEDAVGLK